MSMGEHLVLQLMKPYLTHVIKLLRINWEERVGPGLAERRQLKDCFMDSPQRKNWIKKESYVWSGKSSRNQNCSGTCHQCKDYFMDKLIIFLISVIFFNNVL